MAVYDFDLFVVGAGSGGVRAARIAAGYGAKVAVAEEFRIGGTCVIRGCVPKKLMVYASRFKDEFEDAAGFGWTLSPPAFDWPALVAAKEREISRLSAIYRRNLGQSGVEIFDSRAELEDAQTVRLADGRRLTARYILVATGGAPALEPHVPGCEHAITSNEVFDLPAQPKTLLIAGGGYIAVEFASIFARLGTKVIVATRGENVLRGFDEDMRCGVRDALAHAGVELEFNKMLTEIRKAPGGGLSVSLTEGEEICVDQVLIATGRRPQTAGLGLEKAGVELDRIGAIKVDGQSKSNVDSIYAVGDVTNRLALTPVAIREGHAFADTVFGDKPTSVSHANVPTAVFTTPEVGTVGLTEAEARADYDVVDLYSVSFLPLKATLSGRAEKTIMKIVVDGTTDRVLGVHILGEGAGEMAQLLAIAVKVGAKKSDFDETMAVHPTSAEELVTMRTRTARHERETVGPEGPGAAVAME